MALESAPDAPQRHNILIRPSERRKLDKAITAAGGLNAYVRSLMGLPALERGRPWPKKAKP